MTRGDLAARLLSSFIAELEEQVPAMNTEILALEGSRDPAEHVHSLFRIAHTLKGAARAAGVPIVEQACHELESLLAAAREGRQELRREELVVLYGAADALADAAARLKTRRDLAGSPVARLLASLHGEAPRTPPIATPVRADAVIDGAYADEGQVRVAASKLDDLLAAGADLLLTGGRVAHRAAELEALQDAAAQCAGRWRRDGRRLRPLIQRAGLEAAETRILTMGSEIERLAAESARLADQARADARALSQSLEEMMHQTRRVRMRPFAEACEALPRAARDLASTVGKELAFELAGGDVEADGVVLDRLREPLLQLVRNAVDHGIERPERRLADGKDRRGSVRVRATLRGDRLLASVSDDGAGLDTAAIHAQLARRGVKPPDAPADLLEAMLQARVSTRAEATAVSGRGVGLDIVREACVRLGGRLDVTSEPGRGASFQLDCPVTLATVRALLVSVNDHVVALPLASVERVVRARVHDLKALEGRTVIATEGGPVPVVPLGRLLEPLGQVRAAGERTPLALLRDGPRRLAVAVDELLDVRDLAVRALPKRAGDLPEVRGTALLETGGVALVADPAALVSKGLRADAGPGLELRIQRSGTNAKRRVVVVDDSLTTRALERSILEAAGYDVLTAVDGSDGWRLIQEQGCDLVVADVEMPRMDGFALCEAIRASRRFAELPVVLVTALERPEDRARGLEVGADAYIGKSSFDQDDLLEAIEQLIGEARDKA